MEPVKPKLRRGVAGLDELMVKRNIRLTAAQAETLRAIGDGNLSLGARRVLELAHEHEGTLPREELEELRKKRLAKKAPKGARKPLSTKPKGRPAVTDETLKRAQEMYFQGRAIKEIAAELKINQSSVYKYVDVRKKSGATS